MKKNAGSKFPIALDQEILQINSPQNKVKGPRLIVYKDVSDRWAIVLMKWEKEFCLGIRWFYGGQGTPSVRGYATWLVIPNQLANAILDKLPLTPKMRQKVDEVLQGKYSVSQLDEEKQELLKRLSK